MANKTIGLLVMAYGTPYQESDIERYYTHIRHGRKPPQEQIDDLKARYRAIGGLSPLAAITEAQAKRLEERLNEVQDDVEFRVYLGLKHIEPFIEDAVRRMHEDGISEAVGIVLAPHYSTFSVRSYNERAKQTAEQLGGPTIYTIDQWYDEPKFLRYWAEQVEAIFAAMPEHERERAVLIVSAHSLPEKIIQAGDPYPAQLEDTAKRIAEQAGVAHYAVGWQSAGQTPEPWLGPDVQDLTRELHQTYGYTSFVYAPVGFVSDHLEVLYDNDIECKQVTEEIGARYYRPKMPNTDPLFIDALATVVLNRLAKEGDRDE
ncbi:ferrochelatase [Geobacillus sp. FSL W8-0032]|uniref:Coproporphyrin III ferrochelatase n=2 Tax=Geobacillus TaxID=129337 RepID=A0A679FLP5_9BACL|nr:MULTISPECIES: ferrochelatase [Geobacillus]KYD28725.1 Ferrochelatase, protoheme ferro-lyase [Geobacillus sp. B4113_201601]MEB3751383.1 Ferrochelatase [Geobacillus icigianus]BBW97288.1 ferrochelatase [Geobacillus subterraneus]